MTRSATVKLRNMMLAAGAAGLVSGYAAAPAAAQQPPQQPPQGWYKICQKQQDVDVCTVNFVILTDTGLPVTSVILADVKGKTNARVFQISVPSGRMIQPGIGLQIDGGNATKFSYHRCYPDRCVVEVALTDEMVASFKRGGEMILTSVNANNQQNPIKISLKGFTGAYDGPPMNVADREEMSKQVDSYVKGKYDDLMEKLRAEQDKAKAQP